MRRKRRGGQEKKKKENVFPCDHIQLKHELRNYGQPLSTFQVVVSKIAGLMRRKSEANVQREAKMRESTPVDT